MNRLTITSSLLVASLLLQGRTAGATDSAHQTVGRRFTAIPLVNFSSDDGTGYGLRLNLFDYDGSSIPYRKAYSIQAFFTTKGKQVHRFYTDIPNLNPGQRLEIEVLYEKEDFANFFGDLTDDEADTYTREQKTFEQNYPQLRLRWIRNLRGPWRLLAGARLGHNSISRSTEVGSLLDTLDPLGADGGNLFQINSALRYDTRDDYVNSTSGVLEELLVEYGLGGGGDFSGGQISYDHRHFQPLGRKWVFAHRASAALTFGEVPFYETPALGGSSTIRGEPAFRMRGQGRLLLNGELRWQGVTLSSRKSMHLGLLLFGDAGQIFARSDGPTVDNWRTGVGAGLRFHWQSTIVRADYGQSGSGTGIYITFSQVF
jgi:outer membrane protein assembly factor BamA